MGRRSFLKLLLIIFMSLSFITTNAFGFGVSHSSQVQCIERERRALLEFKKGFQDDLGMLYGWGIHKDCCRWNKIRCSNETGHVLELDLRAYYYRFEYLIGELSPSLLELHYLTYLDLSNNYIRNTHFPEFLGSFSNLRYLNLSNSGLSGTMSDKLGNLSSLVSLDLSGNIWLKTNDLDWLPRLSSLRHFEMNEMNLSMIVNWLQVVNLHSSLEHISLSHCQLSVVNPPQALPIINTTSPPLLFIDISYNLINSTILPWLLRYAKSLMFIDLSHNPLGVSFPDTFGYMISLVHLNLSSTYLEGVIPKNFENLQDLQAVDLSYNNLSRGVVELTKLPLLKELHFSSNQLKGSLPKTIGSLFKLQVLDLSSNSLNDTITQIHLSNLSSLQKLDLSSNSISLKLSSSFTPLFQLQHLKLSSCLVGPAFPQWLHTQKELSHLDISFGSISDTIPNWFWDISYKFELLNLSYNQMRGILPDLSSRFAGFPIIDLSSNRFTGLLPPFPPNTTLLNLSNNFFQGSVWVLWRLMKTLTFLDVSSNLLSGTLPNVLRFDFLIVFNMANNNLSGMIPFIHSGALQTMHLSNNSFNGEIPTSFRKLTSLKVLDLGENKLSGEIPIWWEGQFQPKLMVLRLSSNLFNGTIPSQLCELQNLHILDLSHNNFSATIPNCFNKFIAMANKESPPTTVIDYDYIHSFKFYYSAQEFFGYTFKYIDNVTVVLKKLKQEYGKNLRLVKVIDLSRNNLIGNIPSEITNLTGLIGLNLSRNFLTDDIPNNIGNMKELLSFDLSRNQLSGEIPVSISKLTFISILDLSYNNLSGRIPLSTQLQSFNASTYEGNHGLCGLPLTKGCPGDLNTRPSTNVDPSETQSHDHQSNGGDEDGYISFGFYVSMVVGYIIGFWGVCGSLVLKRSWRNAYFRFWDKANDWIYVTSRLTKARLERKLKTKRNC